MNFVFVLFFRIVVFVLSIGGIGSGIAGLVLNRKKKTMLKSVFVVLIVLPFILPFTTYMSGTFRKAPLNSDCLNNISTAIKNVENVKGEDYFLKEITYLNDSSALSVDFNRVDSCTITLLQDINSLDASDVLDEYIFIDEIFGKKEETSNGVFVCSAVWSDRNSPYEVVVHCGYDGSIFYDDLNGNVYRIDYYISRNSDKILGFVYAPPIIGYCDLAEVINPEQGFVMVGDEWVEC